MRIYQLNCGVEDPLGDIYQDETPPSPQILPLPLEPPAPASKKRKRSTGCGTIVHFGAAVSFTNMWRAPTGHESRWVIPLETQYFSKMLRSKLQFGKESCGCIREGVGCAVCGNPLGVLATQCDIHQTSARGFDYYTFLPSAVSPPIPPFEPRRTPTPPPPPPAPPPRNFFRQRHPTSPPPLYADFTPTPSPEVLPVDLPADPTAVEPSELPAHFGWTHGWDQTPQAVDGWSSLEITGHDAAA
ncbi:hypothetical protein C8R46DRAFT_581935 [Mycena filopes]|nr:hypothetical protein C8R46DRAFT_581935 [Mycena filopes]